MFNIDNIAFRSIAICNNQGWFFNIGYHAIMRVDLLSGNLDVEYIFPDILDNSVEIYQVIEIYNGKLYLAPQYHNKICIYNLSNKNVEYVEIDFDRYGEKDAYNLFKFITIIDGYVYLIPGRFHAIVKLNTFNNSIEYLEYGYEKFAECTADEDRNLIFFSNIHNHENHYFMPSWRFNKVFRFDFCEEYYKTFDCKWNARLADSVRINDGYICSFKNSNKLIFLPDNDKNEYKVLKELRNDSSHLFKCGDRIVVTPIKGRYIELYNTVNGEIRQVYDFPMKRIKEQEWLVYKNVCISEKMLDGKVYLYSCDDCRLITIDAENENVKSCSLNISEGFCEKIYEAINPILLSDINYENDIKNIEVYLKCLLM